MWRLHMDSHLRGVLPGAIPDSWLKEQGLSVCHSCVKLVSTPHLVSHWRKCSAQRSSTLAPVLDVSSSHCSSDLPSLDAVCSLKCPTICFVPNKARQAFARAFSAALMAVISEITVTAWLKLFMLPKCVLPTAKRGGHHNKPVPIESLCAMWAEGQFRDLWHLAKACAPCSKKQRVPSDDIVKKRVNSAISLAQDSLFGKACQVLVSPGLAPNNDEAWKLLVAKHSECSCPSVPTLPSMETAIPHDHNLKAVFRSFPKLTSAGPSGLHIQHIIDASEVPLQTPILQSLRAIINLLAAGSAPSEVSTFLAGGSLTALNKSKPGSPLDIRPIAAVGESLRRLTSKCLCAVKAAEFSEPHRFGVACSNGAEKIAHGLRACVNKYWLLRCPKGGHEERLQYGLTGGYPLRM